MEEIQNEMAVKLDELSNLSVSSKKEKKQKYRYYIEELKERYNHLNQYFFCKIILSMEYFQILYRYVIKKV